MPHGLDILGDKLYALNHANKQGGERIEVFQININNKTLSYLFSITSESLDKIGYFSLNSITVVNENTVFATQFIPTD